MKSITANLILGILFFNFGYSQEIKVYSGAYEKGNAKYQYYESNGERIYHGKFLYIQDMSGGNINYNVSIYEVTQCNYAHGKLQGDYTIDRVTFRAAFRLAIPINEDEYYIASFDNSNEIDFIRRTKYNYKDGLINGPFLYEEIQYKNGVIDKSNYEKIISNIDENWFYGSYSHESINVLGKTNIIGTFDSMGYLDGEWKITFENKHSENYPVGEYLETRIYSHGLLTSLKLLNQQTGKIFYEIDRSSFINFDSKFFKAYDWDMALVEQKFPDRPNERPVFYPMGYKDHSGVDGKIGKPIIAMLAPWFANPIVKGRGFVINLMDEDKKLIYGSDGKLNPSVYLNLKMLYKKEAYSTGNLIPDLTERLKVNVFEKLNINSYDLDETSYPKMFEGIKFDIEELKDIEMYLTDLKTAYHEFNAVMNIINFCWITKSTSECPKLDEVTKKNTPIEFTDLALFFDEKVTIFRKELIDFYAVNGLAPIELSKFDEALGENIKPWLSVKTKLALYSEIITQLLKLKPELWLKESDVFNGIQREVYEIYVKPELKGLVENYSTVTESSFANTKAYLQGMKKVYISFDIEWQKPSTSMVTDPSKEKEIQDLVTYKGKSYKEAFEMTIGYKFLN